MADDQINQMAESAAQPKKAQNDSTSVEQHSLKDRIEVARFDASAKASRKSDRGLRMSRAAPPGAGEMA